ncbi:MAG: transglutaminase-like domain-containing protein, partial [Clostridia bacterium]|nr:transglutaminase-like domain-containing protein [Clostridia bacterium]
MKPHKAVLVCDWALGLALGAIISIITGATSGYAQTFSPLYACALSAAIATPFILMKKDWVGCVLAPVGVWVIYIIYPGSRADALRVFSLLAGGIEFLIRGGNIEDAAISATFITIGVIVTPTLINNLARQRFRTVMMACIALLIPVFLYPQDVARLQIAILAFGALYCFARHIYQKQNAASAYPVLACAVVIALAWACYPSMSPGRISPPVRKWIDNLVDAYSQRVENMGVATKEVPDAFQTDDRLGGNWKPTNRPLLSLSGNPPPLLRQRTKNVYTGKGWEYTASDYACFPFEDAPPDDPDGLLDSGYQWEARFLAANSTRRLPTGSKISMLRVSDDECAPYICQDGTIIVNSAISVGFSYYTQSYEIVRDYDLLLDAIEAAPVVYMGIDLPAINEVDLEIISRTAIEAVGDAENHLTAALNIERYFRENGFVYTLTPGQPDRRRDFVAYFLETKTGYCSYYATAMAVMARVMGIPSRYVEGYSSPLRGTNAENIVREKHAHAWVECWLPGIGWLPFDPTPGGNGRSFESPVVSQTPTSTRTPPPPATLHPNSTPVTRNPASSASPRPAAPQMPRRI